MLLIVALGLNRSQNWYIPTFNPWLMSLGGLYPLSQVLAVECRLGLVREALIICKILVSMFISRLFG
jgi:hypothetical protein